MKTPESLKAIMRARGFLPGTPASRPASAFPLRDSTGLTWAERAKRRDAA